MSTRHRIAQRTQHATLTVFIALGMTGCGHETPIPRALRSVPFNQMGSVSLGMSAAELVKLRELQFAPYEGYREEVGGYAVMFGFGPLPDENARPEARAPLQSITVTESDETGVGANVRFDRYVMAATRSLDIEPSCRFHPPTHGMIAQYQLDDAVFEIAYWPGGDARPSVTRSYRTAPQPAWAAGTDQLCVR